MKKLMALMALTMLTACDYAEKRDQRNERDSSDYRAAMADYQAGRIDAAIAGFQKVVRKDPANAEARFQLAYLLQDAKQSNIEAFCSYREYLMQRPDSEKANIAKERLAICEKALAQELALKYKLSKAAEYQQAAANATAALAENEKKLATMEKDLADLIRRNTALSTDRERLLAIVKGEDTQESTTAPTKIIREAKDLLNEDDESEDRVKTSMDVAALKNEEKDELGAGASILPERKAEDLKRREELEAQERERQRAKAEYEKANAHPETYVVQEGDTLFKIAIRFYHHRSAWTKIRDANKALISADGKVRAGDTIKLP